MVLLYEHLTKMPESARPRTFRPRAPRHPRHRHLGDDPRGGRLGGPRRGSATRRGSDSKTYLDLPADMPSAETFRRVLSALEPRAFAACFVAGVQALAGSTDGKLVVIDGKTARRSSDRAAERSPLHLGSAWVQQNNRTPGRIARREPQLRAACRCLAEPVRSGRHRQEFAMLAVAPSGWCVRRELEVRPAEGR